MVLAPAHLRQGLAELVRPPLPFVLTASLTVPSVVTGERKHAGVIRKYGLNMSRQAFREKAADIGFVKVCLTSLRVVWCGRC